MLPRRLRRTSEERRWRIGARMAAGTGDGHFDVASPVRRRADPRITQRRGQTPALCGTKSYAASETLMLDSRSAGQAMTTVLVAGVTYRLRISGTWSNWDHALENGTPEADAMFPSHVRANKQVGADPDVRFAAHSAPGSYPQHQNSFQINLGSGYAHIEPDGGPFAAPQAGHEYVFYVVGEGAAPSFRCVDVFSSDNYGDVQIVLEGLTDNPLAGSSDEAARCDHGHLTGDDKTFTQPGTLTVKVGKSRWRLPYAITILGVLLEAYQAPVGADVIVDVNKNGTTIFSDQTHRPRIVAAANGGDTATVDVPDAIIDDYISIDIDQIGSTTPGSDLTATIYYQHA